MASMCCAPACPNTPWAATTWCCVTRDLKTSNDSSAPSTPKLDVRPIRHRLADRVRAHMFLRMLSYYISWHMKQRLAPILFQDNDKLVAAAQRSNTALTRAARKRTNDGAPVHSFTTLLADLATICANTIQPTNDIPAFTKITNPTPLQRQAFELLDTSHRHGLA
jgi:hypothetical protein